MNPITPHLGPAERKARRGHLDQHIGHSAMRVPAAMRAVAREVFGNGALSKKHKELTALAVAVSQNCFD